MMGLAAIRTIVREHDGQRRTIKACDKIVLTVERKS